jgi:hypothetical protein
LGYFVSQLFDAFFDGILHQPRLAERKAPEFYLEVKPWARATESCMKSFAAYGASVPPVSPGVRRRQKREFLGCGGAAQWNTSNSQ